MAVQEIVVTQGASVMEVMSDKCALEDVTCATLLSKMNELEKKMDKKAKKMDKMEEKLKEMDEMKEKLKEVDEMKEKLKEMDEMKEKLKEMDEMKEKVKEMDDMKEKVKEMDEMKEKVKKMDKMEEKLKEMDKMKEKVKKNGETIDSLCYAFRPVAVRVAIENVLPKINVCLGQRVSGGSLTLRALLRPIMEIGPQSPPEHVEFLLTIGDMFVGKAAERTEDREEQDWSNVDCLRTALDTYVHRGDEGTHTDVGRALMLAAQSNPNFKWPRIVDVLEEASGFGVKALYDRAETVASTAGRKRPRATSGSKKKRKRRRRTSGEAAPAGQARTVFIAPAEAPGPAGPICTFVPRQASQAATSARNVTIAGKRKSRKRRSCQQ